MSPFRTDARDEHRHAGATLFVAAAGALAGIALGMLLSDRLGGLAGIRRRLRRSAESRATLAERRASAGESYADPPLEDEYEEEYASDDVDFGDDELEEGDLAADVELEQRVLAAFELDPMLRECAVDISALDGSVIELSGWVRAPAERQHAAKVARGVEGVRTVANELVVGDPEEIDAADLGTR